MERPSLEPAPVVAEHATVFRDLFDNHGQFRPVQHDLTGLIVRPHKRLAHMARGSLDSPDNTHVSRCLAEAPWREDAVTRRRIRHRLQETTPHRHRRRDSRVGLEDTRCAHVGSLVDAVDRHDTHREGTYPLAHHPVTSFSVSGPVRVPVGWRLYRRDAELTQWEAAVAKPVPNLKSPTDTQGRPRLPTQVDPVWLQDPAFQARHAPLRTNIALAIALVEEAIRHTVPCGVVVFDAWSLAEDVIQVLARRRKDGISLLKTNRRLETASFHRRDADGWAIQRPGPPRALAEVVPLIPANASRPVQVRAHTYGCFTLAVRIPGLGKVRIVVSVEHEPLTGRAVVLVTHRVDWRAAKIFSLYSHRWPTDTFYQDGQGPLGFHAYRMRSAEAMGQHWCLVFVADAWLPLTCLPAGPGRTRGRIHTIGDACRHQGRAWLQTRLVVVHDQLSQGAPMDRVVAQVFAKQAGPGPRMILYDRPKSQLSRHIFSSTVSL